MDWNLRKSVLYWFVYFIIFTGGTSYVMHYSIGISLLYGTLIATFTVVLMTLIYRMIQRRQK